LQLVDEIQEKQYSSNLKFLKNHTWNVGKNANMAGIAVLM